MLVIRNRLLPFGPSYAAINLFGVLFVKPDVELTPSLINHESIHTAQIRELLWVPFYIVYVLEWLLRLTQQGFNGHRAYRAISFEREAYDNDHNLRYLQHRRSFAQWRRS